MGGHYADAVFAILLSKPLHGAWSKAIVRSCPIRESLGLTDRRTMAAYVFDNTAGTGNYTAFGNSTLPRSP